MKAEVSSPLGALESELIASHGFRHAFFTRRGGVSDMPFGPLNFAASVGDDAARVAENVALAAASLGVPASRLYFLSQVHGVAHVELSEHEAFADVVQREGDITVARRPGVACGVRSADCVPILLADLATGAVAAVHSGWRGTVANAAAAGVAALAGRDVIAAIGPHISPCCFEVGEDVARQLEGCSPRGDVVERGGSHEKPHVDLRAIVRAQLEVAGVTRVDDVAGCTVCEPELFHSHRRDGKRSGRLLSAIVAR